MKEFDGYWQGNEYKLTGEREADGLLVAILLEGHRKGETIYILSEEDKEAQAQAARAEFQEQQIAFRRLAKRRRQ